MIGGVCVTPRTAWFAPKGPGATLLPEARHYFNRSGLRSSEGSRNVERCARVSGLVGK